jgi:hypothetical protein
MNEALDRALRPAAFDYSDCVRCGLPTGVPLSWVLRPTTHGESDPPVRFVAHQACLVHIEELDDDAA